MSQQNDTKMPEIRFKKFDKDWHEKQIGHVLSEIKRPVVLEDHQRYELVTVRRRNEGVVSRAHMYGREILVKNYSRLAKGDYLISKRQVVHGATGIVPPSLDGAIVSNEYLVAVGNSEISTEFLTLISKRPAMYRKFFLSSYGVVIEKLFFDANDWKKRTVTIPEPTEQVEICSWFKSLDRMIGLHQRKYDKLVTLKQAMLQKMFPQDGATTPEIRFKGFSDTWVESELDNEVEFFSGLTYSPKDLRDKGGTLVLRSSNVKDGQIVDSDNVYVETSVVDCDQVQVGDIIVVVRNGSRALIGKHAPITREMSNTVIGAFMTGIRAQHPDFVNAILSTVSFTKQVEMNMGATINQITTGVFRKMSFLFPAPDEQQKIGTYFRNLDILISKHSIQLEKLKNIKSACLEKMFV